LLDCIRYVEPETATSARVTGATGMVSGSGRRQAKEVNHPDLLAFLAGSPQKDIV
jgi:hypothetical protein